MDSTASPLVFDVTTDRFETDVIAASLTTPVLVDFWAEWCGPCKSLGPVLEKLVADFNGAFLLAKVDVDAEQQLAEAFQIRSIPTVMLVKDGKLVDGFPGVLPEGQIREFLSHHGIVPAEALEDASVDVVATPFDPDAEVVRLRADVAAAPDNEVLKLDLALALLQTGATDEAGHLLDGLPANLATDDRTVRARARLGFAALLRGAPPVATLEAAILANPADLRARHLLGVQHIVAGRNDVGLDQFIDMLRQDRDFDGGLPRKALVDAFRIIDDADVVGRYRRKMAALLF